MSADNFLSSLKVGDKIDFYDEEDKVPAHWKVAVIKEIKIYKNECNIHLLFNRWYGTYHIDSNWECEKCNKWIYLKSQGKYYKIIQSLNTHTPHHHPNSKSCSYDHELQRNFRKCTDSCTKCKRVCCSLCFVIKISYDSSIPKNNVFCQECIQICHQNETCRYSYSDKCSTCQMQCCTKCSFIHIYNRSNGKLTSRECYQCYPLKQYQLILTIIQSMLRMSCTTNADINILKLITNFVHNTTLKCEYYNCLKYNILSSKPIQFQHKLFKFKFNSKPKESIMSLSDTIYIDIDRDYAFICNDHGRSRHNPNKLRCKTIQNCHFSDNIISCSHCQSKKICIECDNVIKCRECGKVCHRNSQCNYQDYIVMNNKQRSYKTLLTQCKDCYSAKTYKYQFNRIKLICKSMFLQNRKIEFKIEFEMNIIELILNYYVEDLWTLFAILPASPLRLKNGCYRLDSETGYAGKVIELKMWKTGKHGHGKCHYKLFIPFTGQILSKLHNQIKMLMTCITKTDEYIFNGYVDDERKLVECKNRKTGEQIKIAISPFDKYYATVTDLIGKKGENDKLILFVLNGPKYSSGKLELAQCIIDANIEQNTCDVTD